MVGGLIFGALLVLCGGWIVLGLTADRPRDEED